MPLAQSPARSAPWGWGALYSEVAIAHSDATIRTRMNAEWASISSVSGTLLFLAYSPFLSPPASITRGGSAVYAAYGIFLGMTLACAFTAVLSCSFFSLFLNSIEVGAARAFVATFASILPIPILNLTAALICLAGSICLVALQAYVGSDSSSAGYFICVFIAATFAFLLSLGTFMFYRVHIRKGLRRHEFFARDTAPEEPAATRALQAVSVVSWPASNADTSSTTLLKLPDIDVSSPQSNPLAVAGGRRN